MNSNVFFTGLSNQSIAEIISNAHESVILAGPGVQPIVADALLYCAQRIGKENLILCLDVSEHAMRLGYGDVESLKKLKQFGMVIQHIDNLRFGLIVVDGNGFSFTPNALFLESESAHSAGINALRLTSDQVQEALVRLSPAARAIYIASNSEIQPNAYEDIPVVQQTNVDNELISAISHSLVQAPPAAFDLSRQVRVYSAYLQYVEVSMTGVALQKQKVSIPKVLQGIGNEDSDLQERLNTSFSLLEKDSQLSSKELEQDLKKIRDSFAPSLGKEHGRVILKRNKDYFCGLIEEFRLKLADYEAEVRKNLQVQIDESVGKIALYYLPVVKKNPPPEMLGRLGLFQDDEQIISWIERQLYKVFPDSEKLGSRMTVKVIFKDVTYENLNDKSFLSAIKQAFPDIDWDKAHEESLAVAEKT